MQADRTLRCSHHSSDRNAAQRSVAVDGSQSCRWLGWMIGLAWGVKAAANGSFSILMRSQHSRVVWAADVNVNEGGAHVGQPQTPQHFNLRLTGTCMEPALG